MNPMDDGSFAANSNSIVMGAANLQENCAIEQASVKMERLPVPLMNSS